MNDVIFKYGISLYSQLSQPESPIEFIDPLCTAIKLATLVYKHPGTKISIKKNTIQLQDYTLFQGIQRFYQQDSKHQLHQLKMPLFYFRGMVLGHILPSDGGQYELHYINNLVIKGLQQIKLTYQYHSESLLQQGLNDYIKMLSTPYTLEEYQQEMNQLNKPILFAIYHEYAKLWTMEDLNIVMSLFIKMEQHPLIQNKLADSLNQFIDAIDLMIDTIRPN